MLIHITIALVLPLRVSLFLNRTILDYVKRHYVMKSICGRYVLQSQFSNLILILALNLFRVVTCFIFMGARFESLKMFCNPYLTILIFLEENAGALRVHVFYKSK